MPHKKHWSATEIAKLERLFKLGKTDAQIAKSLKRPHTGVTSKRNLLGLYRRNANGHKPTQAAKEAVMVLNGQWMSTAMKTAIKTLCAVMKTEKVDTLYIDVRNDGVSMTYNKIEEFNMGDL